MAVALAQLVNYLNRSLEIGQFQDYCPNGLQVEGREEITKIATGVTASQALIDRAIDWGADAILVHHGYFWSGEAPQVVGMKRRRLAALLSSNISLLAYHLPLDAHPKWGNNACFGRLLGIDSPAPLEPDNSAGLACIGVLPSVLDIDEIVHNIAGEMGREPLLVRGGSESGVTRVAWCTGAAQGYIDAAALAGAQLFITGEVSEQTVHSAREQNIHFIAAGHHATERYGVQALGSHLAEQFAIEHCYIDIDNPV